MCEHSSGAAEGLLTSPLVGWERRRDAEEDSRRDRKGWRRERLGGGAQAGAYVWQSILVA
jgi:hypothetical protein